MAKERRASWMGALLVGALAFAVRAVVRRMRGQARCTCARMRSTSLTYWVL